MQNRKTNQKISPGKNESLHYNLWDRLMKLGQGTQNILAFPLLTLHAVDSLPDDSLGRDVVLILTVTSKKKGIN